MKREKRGESEQDFEVNIVPIVDALTILIIFMLSAGAYVTIGALDVAVSTDQGEEESSEVPPADVSVVMKSTYAFLVKLKPLKGQAEEHHIPSAGEGVWDFATLKERLQEARDTYPGVETVTVLPDKENRYQDVVQAMEASRKSHKDVVLGGF